jgi:hypothetical protein
LDFLKAGDLGLEAWRGFDFLGDEFLNVVGLFFQAGNSFFIMVRRDLSEIVSVRLLFLLIWVRKRSGGQALIVDI